MENTGKERIVERLKAMGVYNPEMSSEEMFTEATGITHYDVDVENNEWYVPSGAANVIEEGSGSGSGSGSGNGGAELPTDDDLIGYPVDNDTEEPIEDTNDSGSGSGNGDAELPTEENIEMSTADIETI